MPLKTGNRGSAKSGDRKLNTPLNDVKFPPGEYSIHQPNECRQVLKRRPIHLKRCTYDGKEITRAMDKEGFRTLLIPSDSPIIYPKIITNTEYTNLLERTRYEKREEREAAAAAAEQKREQLLRESMERKEAIRRMDLQKNLANSGRMNEIEDETRQRMMHLLQRARDMELENEEAVKKCNKLIVETKCRAIRDAQLAEKKLLKHEDIVEENRLNTLMEEERLAALKAEELKENERMEIRKHFSSCLKEQIKLKEQERQLEYERKLEESHLVNINSIARQEAELEKYKDKEAEREKTRRELYECNEQLKHFKAMEEEESRIMDIRIQKYNAEKAERQAKIVEELQQENLRKEREKDRVAAQVTQSLGLKIQLESMNEARIQEEVEREWRKREKEKAVQNAESLNKLRKARDQQIVNKLHLQAVEIEREKQEFEKILQLQKEAVCREQKEQERKHFDALLHRSEILKQVNQKEKEKIMNRQKMYEEGLAMQAENEQRNRRIREAIERKYQEILNNNVPSTYTNDLRRNIDKIK